MFSNGRTKEIMFVLPVASSTILTAVPYTPTLTQGELRVGKYPGLRFGFGGKLVFSAGYTLMTSVHR